MREVVDMNTRFGRIVIVWALVLLTFWLGKDVTFMIVRGDTEREVKVRLIDLGT
jgi:hypothetical protein